MATIAGVKTRIGTAGAWRSAAAIRAWLASLSAMERWALAAIAAGILARIAVFQDRPLWFDETFTAVIATQPDARSLLRWCLNELGGPLYYVVAWLWQWVAGDSNMALRIPSLAFSIAAVVLAATTRSLDRRQRLALAVFMALMPTAFFNTPNARSYTMLLFLALAQTLAFVELLRRPGLGRAFAWTGWSALALLTHYHMAVICLAQGVTYLVRHRGLALRTWPAMVTIVPVFLWGIAQYRMLSAYATPGNNWYAVLEWRDLLLIPPMLLPFGILSYPVAAAALAVGGHRLVNRLRRPAERLSPAALAAGCGLAAVAAIVAVGLAVPSFSSRYVIPYMPAVMLGMALWLVRMDDLAPRYPRYVILVLGVSSLASAFNMATATNNRWEDFNFQRGSEWIMQQQRPERVVFFWDNPTGDISGAPQLRDVGGFFFRRAGQDPQVVIPRGVGPDGDPNVILPGLAGSDGRGAILWLADLAVKGNRALIHPERLSSDLAWACHKYGSDTMIMLACVPRR